MGDKSMSQQDRNEGIIRTWIRRLNFAQKHIVLVLYSCKESAFRACLIYCIFAKC